MMHLHLKDHKLYDIITCRLKFKVLLTLLKPFHRGEVIFEGEKRMKIVNFRVIIELTLTNEFSLHSPPIGNIPTSYKAPIHYIT